MSEPRSWSLPEQHLMPDAVVAFVDGELSALAQQRASEHIARCPFCLSETRTQRQARSAVRSAGDPGAPAGLLAALRAIPIDTDLRFEPEPGGPDNLAIGPDGQLVAIQRPDRVPGLAGRTSAGFGESSALGDKPMMGSSSPLGSRPLGHHRPAATGRRAVQGAGVVIGGLVLGALVVVGPHMLGGSSETPTEPPVNGAGFGANQQVGFGGVRPNVQVNNTVHEPVAGGDAVPAATASTATPATTVTPTSAAAVPVVNRHRYAN